MKPQLLSLPFFVLVLTSTQLLPSQATAPASQTDSGIEVVSRGPNPVIRFPVMHDHMASFCYGYLYFSADDIRYEPIHPAQNLEHAFRYSRSDLELSKEEYRGYAATLDFRNGSKYTFFHLSRLIVPSDDLLQAVNQFDAALATVRVRLAKRAASSDSQRPTVDSVLSAAVDIIQSGENPNLRFGVAQLGGSLGGFFGDSSYGYLYVSGSSIRYEVISGRTDDSFNFGRPELSYAKRYYNTIELKFQKEKRRFQPLLLEPKIGPSFSLLSSNKDILDAVSSFDRVVKAQIVDFDVIPSTPAPKPRPLPASLVVSTKPPGAQVYMGDQFKGVTSEQEGKLVVGGLPPGSYELRLSLAGYKDWTKTITLDPGGALPVEAKLVSAGPPPLAVNEVEEALKNGVPKGRVMALVNQYGVDFVLTNEVEQRLRNAGADSDVLLAISKNKK